MTSLRSGVKLTLMKKLFLYIFLVLMLIENAYAEQRCTQERQDWIVHIKKQLEAEIEDIKWKDDLCYASISHVKGIPIEEHLSTIGEENKGQSDELLDLFVIDDLKPKDINWVPEDFNK